MYTNIFLFILVFSLFSLYEPLTEPALASAECLGAVLASLALFYASVRFVFERFRRNYCFEYIDRDVFSTLHSRLIVRCSCAAVAVYGLLIYLFEFKAHLYQLPLIGRSDFLLNLFGLMPYVLLLTLIWSTAYASYHQVYDRRISLKRYLISHIRLNAVFVLPWLIFSLLLDAQQVLPEKVTGAIEQSEFISFVVYAVFLSLLAGVLPWLLVKIWNCKKVPEGPVKNKLKHFCSASKIRFADMLIWDLFGGKLITAGVLGFVGWSRYLLISPALFELLDDKELESVVAHEIGHVKYRHLLFYILFILGFAFFSGLLYFAAHFGLQALDIMFDLSYHNSELYARGVLILPMVFLIVVLVLYLRFLFGFYSRNFERQSDAFAVSLTGSADAIVSSLEKIARVSAQSKTAPNWHHFSIQQRIDFLNRCNRNPREVSRHNRKVFRMVAAYIIVFFAVGVLYFQNAGDSFNANGLFVLQRIAEKRLMTEPENAPLHFRLGNIYYEQKKYIEAEQEYLITINLTPRNFEALNNLAWLYATAEDKEIQNPREALRLALKAADIAPLAHILDTVAESYFINGLFHEAVETGKLALQKKPANVDYYQKQLEKFRYHLKKSEQRQKHLQSGRFISI